MTYAMNSVVLDYKKMKKGYHVVFVGAILLAALILYIGTII